MKRICKTGVAAAILSLLFFIPSYFSGSIPEYKVIPTFRLVAGALADSGGQTKSSVDDARKIVQASSRRIAELVRLRPVSNWYFNNPTPRETAEQEKIDIEIAAIHRYRLSALVEVVLAENTMVQVVDQDRGIYRVPIADGQGRAHWFAGSLLSVWHLQELNPSVFSLAEAIRSFPASAALPSGTQVICHLWLGGTSIQSAVHPYPGDIDYSEQFIVKAPTPEAAGEAAAAIMLEFVKRTATNPNLEFNHLHVMPMAEQCVEGTNYKWTLTRILDPSQQTELARQLASTGGGRLNSYWRALIPGGRYLTIGKVFSIHALSNETGKPFFTTQLLGTEYQQAFFGAEMPPIIRHQELGAFASLMRQLALKEAKREKYLKAAKRGFNYLRAIGDLDGMAEVTRIFDGPEARISQHIVGMKGISTALDPATPSRILPATVARDQLLKTATVINAELPIVPGSNPGQRLQVARMLHAIAANIRGRTTDPIGIVEPDAAMAESLDRLLEEAIKPVIKASLKGRVDTIFADHIK
jgi:hypothetical protein